MNTRFKEIRKSKKMTQAQFGNILCLSQNHISDLEKGKKNLTNRIINDLEKSLNVNKEWLETGVGKMFINPVDSLNIQDKEIKEFMNLYSQLDEKERVHVKQLVESALKLKK